MKHIKYLKKLRACPEAIEWAKQFKTLQEAWDVCECGDWMLWFVAKQSGAPGSKSRKKLVLATCECARLSLEYLPKNDGRPLKAILTAEAWASGDNSVSIKDVEAAADAAYADASAAASAASAADAAYADASDASAAASAASAAYAAAAAAAYVAAYAVTYAAFAAHAADADAARSTTLNQCADIVRKHYPKVRIINPKS